MERKRVRTKKWKPFQRLPRSRIILFAIFAVFVFLVSHCGGGTPPPVVPKTKTPVAEKKKTEPVGVPEKKEVAKVEEPEFSYNPAGKPDPFKPFIQLTPEKLPKSAFLTPLQKYDISQLKLVAIVSLPEGNVALVEDQQGKGYFLKRGTAIGRRDGKVKSILKDRVIIEEAFSDVFGQAKVNEISLFLHRPEEGGES
ncbi:MAG: pilus assembly protein PilP [Thermodesulfobacteriota bacterium]